MATTDPIADMLTRIRNASKAGHEKVEMALSGIKLEIARILKEEGYIKDFAVIKDNRQSVISIHLKYDSSKRGVISSIKRISKPGIRVYMKKDKLPKVLGGMGTVIVSTSKGIVTDRKAREMGLGGEIICTVH